MIRARMWYEAREADGAEEGLREKPEGRSPLARPRYRRGMILKWAQQNRMGVKMGVNWINAHEVPVFSGRVLLRRKPENGYWEFQEEALC
jgi:hypothetical protein